MNKILRKIAYVLLLGSGFHAHAQEEVSTAFYEQQVQTFSLLDPSKVPTGILYEHSFPFIDIKAFDGVLRDSIYANGNGVKSIYKTIYSGIIDTESEYTQLPLQPQQYEDLWREQRNNEELVLSGMLFKYNLFKPSAREEGLVIMGEDGVIQDVAGKNPYTESYVFAIAPGLETFYGKELNVIIPSNLFVGNEVNNIQALEIDFNDGNGFVNVQPNQHIPVTYTTAGRKKWFYKVYLPGGLVLEGGSRLDIIDWTNPIPIAGSIYCGAWNMKKKITATKSHLGEYGKLNLTIRCSGDGIINNPLIVVEGFDIGNLLNPENKYGTTNIQSFNETLGASTDLSTLLLNNNREYDIIYVDWENGMDYMERNAYALEEAIKWVNSIKQGNNPNVILGQSMGGVVARYALTDMENNTETHDTNLFISHDSPHQGAMIPDSYQHMYRHLTNQYIKVKKGLFGSQVIKLVSDDLVNMLNGISGLLNQPAAKQLLKIWVGNSYAYDNTAHNAFYTNLRQMNSNSGYPTLTRNIALSNGSECGTTQTGIQLDGNLINFNYSWKPTNIEGLFVSILAPIAGVLGGQLFENANFIKAGFLGLISTDHEFSANLQAKAMKESGLASNIYHADLTYRYKILGVIKDQSQLFNVNVNGRSYGAYEYYGGGTYQLYDETNPSERQNFESTGNYSLSVAPRFGFIPTVSGLDIGKNTNYMGTSQYLSQYIGAQPPTGNYSSPFANFSTEFNPNNVNHHNYRHISFNPRNGTWLASELNAARNPNNTPTTTDCSFYCGLSEIIGSDFICDGANYTYSIPELSGATINWSASGLQIVSGQNTSNLVVKDNGGINPKSIFVTINSGTCGVVTLSKKVHSGTPFMLGSITGWNVIQTSGSQQFSFPLTYTAPNATGATYYEWILPGNYQTVATLGVPTYIPNNWELLASTANTKSVSVRSDLSTNGQIKVRACNECGCSAYTTLSVTHQHNQGAPGYEIAPNPVYTDVLSIILKDGFPVPEFSGNYTNVSIYNLQAQRVHQFEMSREGGNTNVAHLSNGVYKVQIDMQNGNFEVLNLSISR